jgi:hypothetical protein
MAEPTDTQPAKHIGVASPASRGYSLRASPDVLRLLIELGADEWFVDDVLAEHPLGGIVAGHLRSVPQDDIGLSTRVLREEHISARRAIPIRAAGVARILQDGANCPLAPSTPTTLPVRVSSRVVSGR